MSKSKILTLAGAIVAVHLLAVVLKIDVWPVSYYPMFSGQSPDVKSMELYKVLGQTEDGNHIRIGGSQYKMNFSMIFDAVQSKEQKTMKELITKLHIHYLKSYKDPYLFKNVKLVKIHYKTVDGQLQKVHTVLSKIEI